MGQKSNILTLRSCLPANLSFVNQPSEVQAFLQSWKYLTFLERFLNKKNILVVNRELNLINNRYSLYLTLFFRTAKITGYRRKTIKMLNVSKNSSKTLSFKTTSVAKTFLTNFFLLKTNHAVLKIKSINNQIDNTLLKQYYQKTSRFMSTLFLRKFSLYIDFLKLSVLFYLRMASAQTLLHILSQIFKVLPKRKHTRFLFFLKHIFHMFVDETSVTVPSAISSNIRGIKFVVNGKLQGKTRSSSSCIQVGAVPIQSIAKNIEFSRLHVYTLYGAFGFKIWIHRS
jgi:hypothetical protein